MLGGAQVAAVARGWENGGEEGEEQGRWTAHACPRTHRVHQALCGLEFRVAVRQRPRLPITCALQSDMAVPPLKIVGFEGVFGFIAVGLIILPIIQFLPGSDGKGFHEDTIDSFYVRWWSGGGRGGPC